MKNYEYLQVGDPIKETDEIQHRGHWESVKEYGIAGMHYSEGMKKVRRKIEVDGIPGGVK